MVSYNGNGMGMMVRKNVQQPSSTAPERAESAVISARDRVTSHSLSLSPSFYMSITSMVEKLGMREPFLLVPTNYYSTCMDLLFVICNRLINT